MAHGLLFPLLLFTASMSAQESHKLNQEGCPVRWSTKHTRIDPAGDAASPPHQLGILIDGSKITSIKGVLHGPSKPANEAAANHKPTTEEIATIGKNIQSFELGVDPGTFYLGIWVGELKSVDWVELISVTFSDGSRWQPSSVSHCESTTEELVRKPK